MLELRFKTFDLRFWGILKLTILTKKVHNYFEVMINYIIAQTSHVRRNNVSLWVCILANFLFHRWYFLCHKYILDWLFVHSHSWTQTLCTKKGVPHSHLPQFSSCCDDSPQFSSIKAGRQQMWVRHTLLGAECLSSRVAVNKESI